jgi:hypothetical protein
VAVAHGLPHNEVNEGHFCRVYPEFDLQFILHECLGRSGLDSRAPHGFGSRAARSAYACTYAYACDGSGESA